MTTQLTFSLILHTYTALFAGVFFYLLLLECVNKHGLRVSRIKVYSLLALIFSLLTLGSATALLSNYFAGEVGHTTGVSVTTYIPTFLTVQNILLPLMALLSILLFYVIRKNEIVLGDSDTRSIKLIVTLSSLGFAFASILMFLGVLLP